MEKSTRPLQKRYRSAWLFTAILADRFTIKSIRPGFCAKNEEKIHTTRIFSSLIVTLEEPHLIHLVTLNGLQQITNLSVERQLIIRLLGPPTCRYYLLPELSPTCGMSVKIITIFFGGTG